MTNLIIEDIKRVANLSYDWSRLNNKTILISGGTGFIGSFLMDVFQYRNETFNNRINAVSLSRSAKNNDRQNHIVGDVRDKLKLDIPVDYVIHLASNTHPKQYATDPVGTITTNVQGCINLLEFSKIHKIKRFVFASSVEVYGQGSNDLMDEKFSGILNLNSARYGYNESKRIGEYLCRAYEQQYGLDCVIVRFARVFGADKKDDSKAIAQFMNESVKKNNIVLHSLGKQRFSYIYVADAVSALIKVWKRRRAIQRIS